ncbi:hypothetical protein PF008_g18678 [Phytophthora fragariae]|uniref:Uncharacterized protein n=1 Tax=Phytophthora fragariae TaxID=53985 RepID=A0A6G0R4L5_9STRA|nr:hypothetical protein PF008_g18678 [Phytophthora fragariae]
MTASAPPLAFALALACRSKSLRLLPPVRFDCVGMCGTSDGRLEQQGRQGNGQAS